MTRSLLLFFCASYVLWEDQNRRKPVAKDVKKKPRETFEVPATVTINNIVSWDLPLYRLVDMCRRFRGTSRFVE